MISKLLPTVMVCLCICSLSSCYTIGVVLQNKQGEAAYDNSNKDPFLRGLNVRTLDTVIKSKAYTKDVLRLNLCENSSVYYIQHKQSFGAILHHWATFGSRKKIKIIYVCSQP